MPACKKSLPALQRGIRRRGTRPRAKWSTAALPQPRPACAVEVRYLYQGAARPSQPQQVFVQLVCGFEIASADPLVVGINMVQPEDSRVAMENYHMQMRMVHALHQLYPKVHITLHAGELAPGMVTPDGGPLSHPRSRGRGRCGNESATASTSCTKTIPTSCSKKWLPSTSWSRSTSPAMTSFSTSRARTIPLPLYRLYHVPVALSTDDEGVSRINLTHEYVRAATTYPLTYGDLKQMVRTAHRTCLPPPG